MLRQMKEIHDTLTKHTSSTYLFQALMRQIKSERQNELINHKAKRRLNRGPSPLINIYADGDSWFDYPLHKDMIEWMKEDVAHGVTVLDMAHYGDASIDTLGVHKRERMKQIWTDPDNGVFDAICISMGGNDICGDQFIMWVAEKTAQTNHPLQAIIQERFDDIMYVVKSAYQDLITMRNQYLPNAYIFTHGYDFVQPTGIGVCGVGPWLKPSLDYLGWTDPVEAELICTMAMHAFDILMTDLETNNRNVVYVRTQGTLGPGDWSNELHPTEAGFKKLSDKLLAAIRTFFVGRV
jgi:hypothetical protein